MFNIDRYLVIFLYLNNNKYNNYYISNHKVTNNNNLYLTLLHYDLYTEKKKLSKEIYHLFNTHYLQYIYSINLREKNINAIKLLPKSINKFILYKTRNMSFKGFKIKYFNEVVYLFLINIFLKNSKNICKFIKKKLETVHFKEHRRYFLFFFRIINEYIRGNFKTLKINGLSMKFKGKLGRGGNSRTKTMFFRAGKTSAGDKSLALNTNKWSVWTKTGSFSCTFQIFYT